MILAGQEYTQVYMQEFLTALTDQIQPNDKSLKAFKRFQAPSLPPQVLQSEAPLTNQAIREHIQAMLTQESAVLVETGDSWFNGQKLMLPTDCLYEFQMQYGSIGWAVGALLGYALALDRQKRVIALIGDGSFQLTAQEVFTMIRYELNPIIFLINNGGYTIEVEIHDGPYNNIKNWDYAGFQCGGRQGLELPSENSRRIG